MKCMCPKGCPRLLLSDDHRDDNEELLPCKRRRKTFHKETKINNEGKTIIEDRRSWKMGTGIIPHENHIFN